MGILAWIVFGLVAGGLAKLIMPGDQPGGCFVTMLLGIAGGVVGGLIGTALGWGDVTGFDIRSLFLGIGGSLLLLVLYGLVIARRRP